jgi:hypothetical protein
LRGKNAGAFGQRGQLTDQFAAHRLVRRKDKTFLLSKSLRLEVPDPIRRHVLVILHPLFRTQKLEMQMSNGRKERFVEAKNLAEARRNRIAP